MIKLLGRRVLVEREPETDQTRSGLYLPSSARERPQLGHVRAVGRRRGRRSGKYWEPDIQAGDLVMFPKYHDVEVEIGGKTLILIDERELIAKITQ